MRRVFMRARLVLLLAVALAVAATVSMSVGTAAYAATTASSTPCSLDPATSCQSTDGTIALYIDYSDASACTFDWYVVWGDGIISDITVNGPADGNVLLERHAYAKTGTYSISATGKVVAGDCTTSPFSGTFTLLKAVTVSSAPGEACVFNAPNGGVNLAVKGVHIYVSGHVGWAYLSNPATGTWVFGANEGPVSVLPPDLTSKTWADSGTWADVLSTFKNALGAPGKAKTYFHAGNYYKTYRCVTVPTYHSASALSTAESLGGVIYTIPLTDCLSQATAVLAKYGAPINNTTYYLDVHAADWQPNTYYTSVYMEKFGPAKPI